MDRLWALTLVLVPALLSFYNARGGGLERRLIATAKADLDLAEKLDPGPVRVALVQDADFAARRVVLLRQTGSERRVMLTLTIGGYVFAAVSQVAMWETEPGQTQPASYLVGFLAGLLVAIGAGARYMFLRNRTPVTAEASVTTPAPQEPSQD